MKYLVEGFEFDTEKGNRQLDDFGNLYVYEKDEDWDMEQIIVYRSNNKKVDLGCIGGNIMKIEELSWKIYDIENGKVLFNKSGKNF